MTIETSSTDEESCQLVPLGVFARPHGLAGELRVHLYNRHSRSLDETRTFRVELPTGVEKRIELLEVRQQGSKLIVSVEGVTSRDDAEALKGALILLPREDLPSPGDGEFYDIDLVGLRVLSPEGEDIGEVEDVEHPPANDVLTIRLRDGEFVDLPMIADFVHEIDLSTRIVTIDLPAELPRRSNR